MSVWSAIVLVVLIVSVAMVMRSRHRGAGNWRDNHETGAADASRESELETEIDELKERIKVLERIAYDDRRRLGLADEIEQLRDK